MAVKAHGIETKSEYKPTPPKAGSATQKRKANKTSHMKSCYRK